MYGMMYSANVAAVAVSAAQDVFEIVAPSDAVVVIHEVYISQTSDYGDAAAEGLQVKAIKNYSTSGSGGSTPTPTPLQSGFAAAGSTVEANNTTQASTGTPLTLVADSFNVQIGYQWRATPETRIVLSPSQRLVWTLSAPADAVTLNATMIFEEIGG